jgi:hypothetical protein
MWLPMQNRLGLGLTEFMRHFLGAEGEEVRKAMSIPLSNDWSRIRTQTQCVS